MSFKILTFFVLTISLIVSSCSHSFKLVANTQSHSKQNELSEKNVNSHVSSFNVKNEIPTEEKVDSISLLKTKIKNENLNILKKVIFSSLSVKEVIHSNNINLIKAKVQNPFVSIQKSSEIELNEPSGNFWGDLIKDFFLGLLIGAIIALIITCIIVYGSPELIYWILIILGCLAALFIVVLFFTWIVLMIQG
jgi:hypothetical protein